MRLIENSAPDRAGEPRQQPGVTLLKEPFVAEPIRIGRQDNGTTADFALDENRPVVCAGVNDAPRRIELVESQRTIAGDSFGQLFFDFFCCGTRQGRFFLVALQRDEVKAELPSLVQQQAALLLFRRRTPFRSGRLASAAPWRRAWRDRRGGG